MALGALTDEQAPNPFRMLAERGLPFAYAAGTQQIFRYIERRLGMTKRIDREARDYIFPQLRELGIIEPATVRSKAHARRTGELLLRGKHDPPKTPNCAYMLIEEAKALLDADSESWQTALDDFVRGDAKRRVRVQQIATSDVSSAPSASGGKHSALIHAAVSSRDCAMRAEIRRLPSELRVAWSIVRW
jgi:hypothetical protein